MACQWYIQPLCGSQVVFHCKQNGCCLCECASDSHEVSHRKAIIFSADTVGAVMQLVRLLSVCNGKRNPIRSL